MEQQIKITCPHCGHEAVESAARPRGVRIYKCPGCTVLLRARHGDCCVACAYGDRACGPSAGSPAALTA
jgi:hypothetical protein